jgi:hypothetical protein
MIDKDKVIQLAREVGFEVHPYKQQVRVGMDALIGADSTPKLLAFAQAIYRQGLEDAAKVCEANQDFEVESNPTRINFSIANVMARQCAAAIRSLKESTNG